MPAMRSTPNAEIIVLAREHDFWMADDGAGDAEMVRKTRARNRVNLAPYRERLRLVRDGEEVLGCTALCAPAGHSPGHTCWRIASRGDAGLGRPGASVAHPKSGTPRLR